MTRPTPPPVPSGDPPPLLTVRTAVVLLIALIVGVGVGVLTYVAGRHPAEAALAGIGAAGVTAVACHGLIG